MQCNLRNVIYAMQSAQCNLCNAIYAMMMLYCSFAFCCACVALMLCCLLLCPSSTPSLFARVARTVARCRFCFYQSRGVSYGVMTACGPWVWPSCTISTRMPTITDSVTCSGRVPTGTSAGADRGRTGTFNVSPARPCGWSRAPSSRWSRCRMAAVDEHNAEYFASSLPVVKNGEQWKKFAALNSQLLMHVSADFLHTWYEYCDSLGPWYFRLDGFCWYLGHYSCTNLPDGEKEDNGAADASSSSAVWL